MATTGSRDTDIESAVQSIFFTLKSSFVKMFVVGRGLPVIMPAGLKHGDSEHSLFHLQDSP